MNRSTFDRFPNHNPSPPSTLSYPHPLDYLQYSYPIHPNMEDNSSEVLTRMLSSSLTHHSSDSLSQNAQNEWLEDHDDDDANSEDGDYEFEHDDNDEDEDDEEEDDDEDDDDEMFDEDRRKNGNITDDYGSEKSLQYCSNIKKFKNQNRITRRFKNRHRNRSHPQQVHQRHAANMRERKRMQSINEAFEVSF